MARRSKVSCSVEVLDPGERYPLREICVRAGVEPALVIELVDYGVIVPLEQCPPERWSFDMRALLRLHRALRLQRDLQINLAGLAVSLDLLEEVEQLRREVEQLRRRLQP